MTVSELVTTAATALFLRARGGRSAVSAPPNPMSADAVAAEDLRDAPGTERSDTGGMWLALGSFALMSFMVYRWISEDERPPTIFNASSRLR